MMVVVRRPVVFVHDRAPLGFLAVETIPFIAPHVTECTSIQQWAERGIFVWGAGEPTANRRVID